MTSAIASILLIISGLLDGAWPVSLNYPDGASRPDGSFLSLGLLASFVYLLGRSLEALPVGTAYAVWTGIGAVGTTALGVFLCQEPVNAIRLCSIFLVIAGIAGLKLSS